MPLKHTPSYKMTGTLQLRHVLLFPAFTCTCCILQGTLKTRTSTDIYDTRLYYHAIAFLSIIPFTFLPFSFTFSFISKFNRKFQIIITRSKLFSQHFSFKQEFMLYFDIFYVFLLTFVSFRYKISL